MQHFQLKISHNSMHHKPTIKTTTPLEFKFCLKKSTKFGHWCVAYVDVEFADSNCDSKWRRCQCHDSDHVPALCCSTVLLLLHTLSVRNGGVREVKASDYSVSCNIPALLLLSFNIQNQPWAKVNVNSPGCQGLSGALVFPHPSAAQRGIPGMRQWHWSLAAQRHIPPSPLSSAILMILAWE